MATNFYFNNFTNSQEQLLIENLIIESIKIYGQDMYYCPRKVVDKDDILQEDDIAKYDIAYQLELYIKNVDGFEGDGKFLSKFGLEIRDQITLTVAQRIFSEEVGVHENMPRPNEGDLIYFPVNRKIFQVKYVDSTAVFYQLGAIQTYDLVCELFEYSNERLNTGIEDIDQYEDKYSLDMGVYSLLGGSGPYTDFILTDNEGYALLQTGYSLVTQAGEAYAQNDEFETVADGFIDFSEIDPFSEGDI